MLGMPDMYFFRHSSGKAGIQPESQYGDKYFYNWWVQIKFICQQYEAV
jgi:hypothetical protein